MITIKKFFLRSFDAVAKKFNIFLLLFIIAILLPTALVLIISFRSFAVESSIDKANTIAKLVRDGLTTHMENGIMDKRNNFLSKIRRLKGVEELKILRSPLVDKQFGKSVESFQRLDDMERRVLKEGKELNKLEEGKNVKLKVVVPYVASQYESPDCLHCHQAKEGDVLGAISMTFDITDVRNKSLLVVLEIVFATFVIILLGFYIFNRHIKEYTNFFGELQNVFQKAFKGDYTGRLHSSREKDLDELSLHVNLLLEKLEKALHQIQKNVTYFLKTQSKKSDPILTVQQLVEELAAVYKFKNILERDQDIEQIYSRLAELLKEKFGIKHFVIYEFDTIKAERRKIYSTVTKEICDIGNSLNNCRAYRTKERVNSDAYIQICRAVTQKDAFYICLPLTITKDFTIVVNSSPTQKRSIEIYGIKSILFKTFSLSLKPL